MLGSGACHRVNARIGRLGLMAELFVLARGNQSGSAYDSEI